MNESFSSYSPRVKPLNYDALLNRTGVIFSATSLLESGTLDVAFTDGLYFDTGIPATGIGDAGTDSATIDLSFTDGLYFSAVTSTQALPQDKSVLKLSFSGGSYTTP